MDNHIHIIMKSPDGKNLSGAMKSVNVSYTKYYRRKYKGVGRFFQDRFKSFIIQGGKYLLECGRYVELNPVRAGIVGSPGSYKWTSYRVYVQNEKNELVDIDPGFEG